MVPIWSLLSLEIELYFEESTADRAPETGFTGRGFSLTVEALELVVQQLD